MIKRLLGWLTYFLSKRKRLAEIPKNEIQPVRTRIETTTSKLRKFPTLMRKSESFNAQMRRIGYKGKFGRKVVRSQVRRERGYQWGYSR